MAPEFRPHALMLSDADVALLERALRGYSTLLATHANVDRSASLNHEADINARICGRVNGHHTCDCAKSEPGGS